MHLPVLPFAFGCVMAVASAADAARSQSVSAEQPIRLICPDNGPDTFCQALRDALSQAEGVPVHMGRDPMSDGRVVRFVMSQSGADVLSGHLEWQSNKGKRVVGPTLELAVMDIDLTPQILTVFARHLVQMSNF